MNGQNLKAKPKIPFEPDDKQVTWLKGLVESLNPGGLWNLPAYGVTFRKTGATELTLESIMVPKGRMARALEIIEKTKKVAEAGGLTVKTDQTAKTIIIF